MHRVARFGAVVVLVFGIALVWAAQTARPAPLRSPLSANMPPLPGYAVTEQRISDDERSVSGMTDYVARAYSVDSVVLFTTLVSYYDRQTNGRSIHSPRNCLPGAGWEIVSGTTTDLSAGRARNPVNLYVVKNGSNRALVLYWYQGRGRVVASELQVKWNLLRDAALTGRTEEALVRVVVPIRGEADSRARVAVATEFGKSIAARIIGDVAGALPPVG